MTTVASVINRMPNTRSVTLRTQESPSARERLGHGRHLHGGDDMSERTCSIEDCDRKHWARGWCGKHYQRWQKTGSPHRADFFQDPDERFWSYVDADGDCWEWTGARGWMGHGEFKKDGRYLQAHRWVWERLVGPIPDAFEIDHLCRNPPCVNPDHLEPVPKRTNWERSEAPSAKNARKTHCKYGHAFTPENTYVFIKKDGKQLRQCRTCHKRHSRAYHRRTGT